IKFEIHKIEDGEAAAPTFAGMAGKSLIIDGTVDNKPFSFSSSLDEEQEREGTFTVGSKTNKGTLTTDPTGWFASNGQRLDPSDPNVDRSKIEQNIKASLDAFEDDDRDGRRD